MWFWWFVLACDILIPMGMLVGGRLMWKRCPKQINGFLGYRTFRSMKNMDTWIFAHTFCGKLWWKVGFVMLILTVLLHLPFYQSSEGAMGILCLAILTIQLVVLVATVFPTEAALKKAFYDDGTRR